MLKKKIALLIVLLGAVGLKTATLSTLNADKEDKDKRNTKDIQQMDLEGTDLGI